MPPFSSSSVPACGASDKNPLAEIVEHRYDAPNPERLTIFGRCPYCGKLVKTANFEGKKHSWCNDCDKHWVKAPSSEKKVKLVGKKVLKDYMGMNREAAKAFGFTPLPNEDEIFVAKGLSNKDYKATVKHETVEQGLMEKGSNYWAAHKKALKAEKYASPRKKHDHLAVAKIGNVLITVDRDGYQRYRLSLYNQTSRGHPSFTRIYRTKEDAMVDFNEKSAQIRKIKLDEHRRKTPMLAPDDLNPLGFIGENQLYSADMPWWRKDPLPTEFRNKVCAICGDTRVSWICDCGRGFCSWPCYDKHINSSKARPCAGFTPMLAPD